MDKLRVVFMGTPVFAVPILEGLIKNYQVVGVVSQPDKKIGRKQVLTPTPIKEVSALYNIPIFQPVNIRKDYKTILDWKPDLIVTCAYGQIIPNILLDTPKYHAINVHASLLPKLRGGAPIHHAIIDGYQKTGITIMYMSEKMDAGDILAQEEIEITSHDTMGSLHDKLSQLGKDLLLETLPKLLDHSIEPIKQDEQEVTYGYNITKEDEKIDFNKSKEVVERLIRGLNPVPGAYALMNGKRLKVYAARIGHRFYPNTPNGTIAEVSEDGISVVCNHEEIILTDIAIEGKKRCLVREYLHGNDPSKLLGIVLE